MANYMFQKINGLLTAINGEQNTISGATKLLKLPFLLHNCKKCSIFAARM